MIIIGKNGVVGVKKIHGNIGVDKNTKHRVSLMQVFSESIFVCLIVNSNCVKGQ